MTIGYYYTLEALLEALPRYMILDSKATTLKELLDELKEIKQLINDEIKGKMK